MWLVWILWAVFTANAFLCLTGSRPRGRGILGFTHNPVDTFMSVAGSLAFTYGLVEYYLL